VAQPPLAAAAVLLAANRQRLALDGPPPVGQSWTDLRHKARRAAVEAARQYLRQAGEPSAPASDASLLLAGHQPELFHPGVWVKNFALNRLARDQGATPLNLVVDNDTAKSVALRLPVLASSENPQPHVAHLPFDHWSGEVPYEELTVRDEQLFASLPDRAGPLMQAWNFTPLLPSFWDEVRRHSAGTPLLGERMVRARRALERRWGCQNLELPVSALCRTEPFICFASHLLRTLPRFHNVYNTCVHEYRRRYGLRSRNHPVPDLAQEDEWLEAPFWAWREGGKQRGRLFVRRSENGVELRSGAEPWPSLPLDSAACVAVWADLERRGFKVRSRALTNTLFARLFLADLFIHGIGGGKYDELTDEIARRFYGIEPPGYMVLSATLLLPLPTYLARPDTCRRLARELRDLHYNPQRHVSSDVGGRAPLADLIARKRNWIERQPQNSLERRERFRVLRELTAQLEPAVVETTATVREELRRCELELQANAVLQRRDYPFCLYPDSALRPFCTQFLQPL
jgi:hypothetical protein